MLPAFMKTGRNHIVFYVALVLIAAVLCVIWKYGMFTKPAVLSEEPLPASSVGDQAQSEVSQPSPPSEWQKMSVTVEGNTGALMTTLATALFGAIGWLMIEARRRRKRRNIGAGLIAAFCTGASLFFGAASQGHLVAMLNRGHFDPYDPTYRIFNMSQFGFLIAAACFLAGFAFYGLSEGN